MRMLLPLTKILYSGVTWVTSVECVLRIASEKRGIMNSPWVVYPGCRRV
jgi:hypothetical protein